MIIGVGNPLLKDEGVGIHVINQLKKMNLKDFEIIDDGPGGMGILDSIGKANKVIINDALLGYGNLGDVYKIDLQDILKRDVEKTGVASLHDLNLITALKIGKELNLLSSANMLPFFFFAFIYDLYMPIFQGFSV